jgi:hypothetical protein
VGVEWRWWLIGVAVDWRSCGGVVVEMAVVTAMLVEWWWQWSDGVGVGQVAVVWQSSFGYVAVTVAWQQRLSCNCSGGGVAAAVEAAVELQMQRL